MSRFVVTKVLPEGMVEVEIRPEIPTAAELDALLDGGHDGEPKWHIMHRRNGRYSLCGKRMDPDAPSRPHSIGGPDNCKACDAIARSWVEGNGWEGHESRPPGRQFTEELRWSIECS